jgi:F-box protein 18 (helicase)
MKPTEEQQAIIEHDLQAGQTLKVKAYAGTGKTSTLVKVAEKYPHDDVLYLAFNKSVADEASMRFPTNTIARTTHSFAHGAIAYKYSTIKNIYNYNLKSAYDLPLYEASLLLKSLEAFLNSADPYPTEDHIAEDELQRLDPEKYKDAMVRRVELLFRDMCESKNGIPMTHSGYLKLFQLQKPWLGVPVVFMDEAQDTNPVQLRILLDQIEKGAKVYLVGDPYQQIYSWRGALDAMEKVTAPEYRITQSFRFGDTIAGVASTMLGVFFDEQVPLTGMAKGDLIGEVSGRYAVLVRTNAGLIEEAYTAAKNGATIHVVGEAAFQSTLSEIDDIFCLYAGKKKDITNKRFMFHANYDRLKDYAEEALDYELQSKINVIEKFGSSWPTVKEFIQTKLVPESIADVRLSTTHKAKGLEWDQVKLSEDFADLYYEAEDETGRPILKLRTPSRDRRLGESVIHPEEINLQYVAATRAKKVLQPTNHIRRLLREHSTLVD